MEKLHQDILSELREQILDDMDVRNGVLPVLLAKYILKQEDVTYIESGITLRNKAEILLDILPKRGVNAFDAFRESLRHHYRWLSDGMDDLELKKTGRNSTESLILPPTSPLTIIRDDKIKQLIEALKILKPDGYLTLHGMKGFGRSCLTASALNDTKLAEDLFHNKIYWLKFGYDKRCKYKHDDEHSYEQFIQEEITKQLSGLYYRITNKELLTESLKNELFKIFLSNHFNKTENHDALLVLEDVYDKNFINAFDFKCKTLVITTDLDVLDGKRGIVIKMDDGFTEAETLGLFAKVLDINVDQLPLEAKLLHKECKGMPLLIAMFSANFEEFKHDMNKLRWQYYLKCIQNKDTNNTILNKFLEKQEAVFNMSIERLSPNLKACYEQLAIFSEDVNITGKTLEVLWSYNLFEVEEMMLELCHKSLAAMRWNANLGCYIYGVHDLLLCHLRRKLGIDKLTEMHKFFIEKYRKYCDNDFSKLPNDNYSYSYIGHHLELAKLYDEFPTLYLDFNFLEAKLNHTGLCDLLIDFNKYKKYIISNDNESNKVNDLEKFLQEQASNISKHRRKKCLDLIQIAMNHFRPGYVVETATHIAEKRLNNLYLSQNTKLQQNNITESEEVCTETYTISFTDDPDVILIGNKMGEIIQWHSEHKKQIVYKVYEKDCAVEKIVISKNGESFLTLCNGIVKLFILYSNDYYNKLDTNIQSPKQKQTFWNSIYSNDGHNSQRTFSIEDEIISDVTFGHDDRTIAVCTDKGIIQIWDRHGNILTSTRHNNNSSLRYLTFTTKNSLLHAMNLSNGYLVTYRQDKNNIYTYNSQYNLHLLEQEIIFFQNVPKHDNSLIIITERKVIHVKWFCPSTEYLRNYEKKAKAENDKTVYVCASITYDGLYLVLADSEGLVNVWKIDGGFHPIAVYKSRVSSLDTYWFKKEGYHYICGNENNLVHKWKFPVEEASDTQVRNLLFDALVKQLGEVDLIAKTTNANSVVVLFENKVITESSSIDGDIICLKLSPNGKKLVYVTKQSNKGIVRLLDIESKTTINILKLPEDAEFITFLTIENDEVIIFRETIDTLRIWKNNKVSYLIETSGPIISIHDVHNEYVITVAQSGVIILYNISGTKWTIISRAKVESANINIYFSCFSHRKQFLALLNDNQDLFLYNLQEDDTVTPRCIIIGLYYNQSFIEKPTYCDISQDQKYLAIGFITGSITIIDIEEQKVLRTLYFHTSAITQLNWAPASTEVPLLLSLNGDELAWWNVQLTSHSTQQKRRSRYGLVRSISTPSASTHSDFLSLNNNDIDISSIHLSNSSTGILEKYEELNKTENIFSYWKRKVGRNSKKPELLGALELPPSCIPKVCISADFSKFITVDIYGSVSTFKLFDYSHVQ